MIYQSINVDNNRNDQAAMLTPTQTNTVIQSHQTNSKHNSTNYFYSNNYSNPARSAINCDVYVGGKVRVAKFMMSWNLQLNSSK